MRVLTRLSLAVLNRYVCLVLALLWVLAQVMYIDAGAYTELVSDQGYYQYLAQQCAQHGTIYPDYSSYNAKYIFNPGWVNFIVLWIKIFGSVRYLCYANVVFNVAILILVWRLALALSGSRKAAYLAAYMFMACPTFLSMTIHAFSEPLFIVLMLLSFHMVIQCRRLRWLLVAGIVAALCNWVRPFGIALIVSAAFYLIYTSRSFKAIGAYLAGYVATILVIGCVSLTNFPDFIFQARTGGYNLIHVCREDATGDYDYRNFEPDGYAYIEGMESDQDIPVWRWMNEVRYKAPGRHSYSYMDSVWLSRSIAWIKDHPASYLSVFPDKVRIFTRYNDFLFSYRPDAYGRGYGWLPRIIDNPVFWIYNKCWMPGLKFLFLCCVLGMVLYFWRSARGIYMMLAMTALVVPPILMYVTVRYNIVVLPYVFIADACLMAAAYRKINRFAQKQSIND